MQWIHQRAEVDFSLMTDLSKLFRHQLTEKALVKMPELVLDHVSQDRTHKWLFCLADNNKIKTVFIPDCNRGGLMCVFPGRMYLEL